MAKIGFLATRLAGVDGVSLETHKWAAICERLGHEVFYCAGELEENAPPGRLIPEMHFQHPEAIWTHDHAFGHVEPHPALYDRIRKMADFLKGEIAGFIKDFGIEIAIVEQALTIPMQIPLGVAVRELLAETRIPVVAHHHDFYWERERFRVNCIGDILQSAFPPADIPTLKHAVINTFQVEALRERFHLDPAYTPNVWDFDAPPPKIDAFNADFRESFGIGQGDAIILQPTRIVRRKAIERAVELVRLLDDERYILVLTGTSGDEADDYGAFLKRRISEAGINARWIGDRLDDYRDKRGAKKVYALWDAYLHADFITYPSEIEGFGNALLETIYFRKPFMINRYPVYAKDIAPLGLDCVEIDGMPEPAAAEQVRAILADPDRQRTMTAHNFAVGREHFSFDLLEAKLRSLLAF
jgi:glycosyltransferase involved in cell wall biosynthesis